MTRRHGNPPLAVQRQCRRTLKNDVCHKPPQKCTFYHFSGGDRTSQRQLEFKFNEINNLMLIAKCKPCARGVRYSRPASISVGFGASPLLAGPVRAAKWNRRSVRPSEGLSRREYDRLEKTVQRPTCASAALDRRRWLRRWTGPIGAVQDSCNRCLAISGSAVSSHLSTWCARRGEASLQHRDEGPQQAHPIKKAMKEQHSFMARTERIYQSFFTASVTSFFTSP